MSEAVTKTPQSSAPAKKRFLGVDVARGVALFAMLAANIYDVVDENGNPTLAGMTVTGRSATMFVMVAGISLAFITGGRHPVRGHLRRATSVGVAVRAVLIAVIGLSIAYASPDLEVILPNYGLYFLLAIPLIGLRPRTLAAVAGGLVVVGPLIILGATALGLQPVNEDGPTFTDLVTHPLGFLLQLLVTGGFPAVVYLAYLIAGLAIGRLDLSSTRVATWLFGGGLALAVAAWFASSLLLFNLGGLQHLMALAGPGADPAAVRNDILWNADRVPSWWWLAVRSHHSCTPFDALHSLGVAMAILGGVLLITKLRPARRLLWPVGVAGAMTLTIYSAHALVLGSGLFGNRPNALYAVTVAGALIFAVVWRRLFGQGPLERIVSAVSARARRAAMSWQWLTPRGRGQRVGSPSA
ncbi:DUF418 domain-containing protein [Amycolatopsis taiwanensis]|uniref:DUF418 domain-containing protein n=1 Tax=Amycolatopsis taiwanensis TaxID=342230 RepID=UPI0004B73B0A|nr:heparan-alpha-glucosaminide N-acetyltransferase domain-containing protein [Amycolatopsis taiwanensis]